MKITIDTKEDSKEEIKKAINFLSSLSDGAVYTNCSSGHKPEHQQNIFSDDSSPAVGGGIFSMFGDTSSSAPAASSPAPVSPEIPAAPAEETTKPAKKPEIQIIDY